jgi:hypothetical protein
LDLAKRLSAAGKAFLNVRVALRQFCGIAIDDGLCGYPEPR